VSAHLPAISPITDLVLREFRQFASSNKCNEVGLPKHLYGTYSGVEIYFFQHRLSSDVYETYPERLEAGMVLN